MGWGELPARNHSESSEHECLAPTTAQVALGVTPLKCGSGTVAPSPAPGLTQWRPRSIRGFLAGPRKGTSDRPCVAKNPGFGRINSLAERLGGTR